MKVQLRFFAGLREQLQLGSAELEISGVPSLEDVRTAIAIAYPSIASLLPFTRLAVDHVFVGPEHLVSEGAEVALIPPVSGG